MSLQTSIASGFARLVSAINALDTQLNSVQQNVFIQQTDPLSANPYVWFKTDASGKVIDILKG